MTSESTSPFEHSPADLPIPQESLKFDLEKAQAWISSEADPDIKEIKRKIVENIQHVPFAEFRTKSEEIITEAINSLNESGEEYAVFFDHKPHASKRWIYELNKNCFTQNPPTDVDFFVPAWEKIGGNERLKELTGKGVHTFLVSDDAVYSGEQILNRQINPILRFYKEQGIEQKPNFVIAVPYATSRFIQIIEELKKQDVCVVDLHIGSVMPSLSEILTDEEKNILNERRNGNLEPGRSGPTYLSATLTCFDHKVADAHSFSEDTRNALGLDAKKPYNDEQNTYFENEEKEFAAYKAKVLKE